MVANKQLQTIETILVGASGVGGGQNKVAILGLTFCNTGAVAVTISIYSYSAGGVLGPESAMFIDIPIESKGTYFMAKDELRTFALGDTLSAIASMDGVVNVNINFEFM